MNAPATGEPQPAAIAAAIIAHDGKVLLVRRRVAEGKLSWQFPAGAIEEGESPDVAAVREAKEETGLTVEASTLLGERVHPATGRMMIYFACHVICGNATVADTEELVEIAWSTLSHLPDYVPYGLYEPVQLHLNSVLAP